MNAECADLLMTHAERQFEETVAYVVHARMAAVVRAFQTRYPHRTVRLEFVNAQEFWEYTNARTGITYGLDLGTHALEHPVTLEQRKATALEPFWALFAEIMQYTKEYQRGYPESIGIDALL